jgi:hypothetical protein
MPQNRSQRRQEERVKRKLAGENPTFEFTTPTPGHLLASGPVINTDVGVAEEHAKALLAAGLPVPAPVHARFLLDTGAGRSMVRHDIAQRAGLKLINDSQPIKGIGVDTTGRVYLGSIRFGFTSKRQPGAQFGIMVNAEIASGQLPFADIDGLIGRDVLNHFRLIYDGQAGRITLTYLGSIVR